MREVSGLTTYEQALLADGERLGHRNLEVMALAGRHCRHLNFEDAGLGRSAAEAITGLPIDSRRAVCPQADGGDASPDLHWLFERFQGAHCLGCLERLPGDVETSG